MAYSKLYDRTKWENKPSAATPLDEDHLNNMDIGIDNLDDRSVALDARMTAIEEMTPQFIIYMTRAETAAEGAEQSEIKSKASEDAARASEENSKASEDAAKTSETNAATYAANASAAATRAGTKANAASASADAAEKSAEEAKAAEESAAESAAEAKASEDLVMQSATEAKAAEENARKSEELAGSSADDSEAWAVGKRGGVDVLPSDETYENSSKWHAERSRQNAASADASAQEAQDALNNAVERVLDAFGDNVPTVWVDLNKGQLMWEGGKFVFNVNNATGQLMWELS